MKIIHYCLLSVMLLNSALLSAQFLTTDATTPPFLSKVGMGLGVTIPFGSGVLRDGAYPFGLSMYIILTHTSARDQNYELLTGAEILADASGGIYFALPVLINRSFQLTNFGDSRFAIDGFAGLGYCFHHLFSRTEGITIKNQHAFGLDAGFDFNCELGERWALNMRTGVFRSFTRPVKLHYDGMLITSKDKFNYATFPIMIGFSRKIGEQL